MACYQFISVLGLLLAGILSFSGGNGNVIKENEARHRRQIYAEAEEGISVDSVDPDIIFDDGLDRALLNKPWNPAAPVPNNWGAVGSGAIAAGSVGYPNPGGGGVYGASAAASAVVAAPINNYYQPSPPQPYYPNPFFYGQNNNQGFYYNGSFYPINTTTSMTTTSTTPRYGNIYAFFFRNGTDYGDDVGDQVEDAIDDALLPLPEVWG